MVPDSQSEQGASAICGSTFRNRLSPPYVHDPSLLPTSSWAIGGSIPVADAAGVREEMIRAAGSLETPLYAKAPDAARGDRSGAGCLGAYLMARRVFDDAQRISVPLGAE